MQGTKLSRRGFLRQGGLVIGATVLTGAGLTSGCSEQPVPIQIEWIKASYGDTPMNNDKILVAYSTSSGSTVGVADAIGKKLGEMGQGVDVLPIKDVADLEDYRAVVLGSAIHGGQWLPEAVQFVTTHQKKLNAMPTAYFLVCLMVLKETEQDRAFVSEFLKDVRTIVKPVAEGRFAGAYLPEKYDFFTRFGLKFFAAYLKIKPGDYRNWDAINAWAESTRALLV